MNRMVKTESRYGMFFAQYPGFLLWSGVQLQLGPNASFLMLIALSKVGASRKQDGRVSVSYGNLKREYGLSNTAVKNSIATLVEALPTVVSYKPGVAQTNTGGVLTVNMDELERLHREWLVSIGRLEATEPVLKVGTEAPALADDRGPLPPEDLFGTPTITSQPSEPKASRKSKAKAAETRFEESVRAGWNAGVHPRRVERRTPLSADERRLTAELLDAHKGDEAAALESWGLAVTEVAEVSKTPADNYWGDAKKRPAIINLLRNWGKWADAGADRLRREEAKVKADDSYTAYEPELVI